ncbi:MAG TPA: hypothetical protein VIG97_07340 [Luteimonas sp.]
MIVPYANQPIEPGMIVCRRSIMIHGIASRPVTVVKVAGSRATVRDRDGEEKRIDLSTIAFIVDTMDEGWAVQRASADFMAREMEIEAQQNRERAERRLAAIAAVVGGAS